MEFIKYILEDSGIFFRVVILIMLLICGITETIKTIKGKEDRD